MLLKILAEHCPVSYSLNEKTYPSLTLYENSDHSEHNGKDKTRMAQITLRGYVTEQFQWN